MKQRIARGVRGAVTVLLVVASILPVVYGALLATGRL